MPESIDQQIGVASVYANALFDLAQAQGREREVGEELVELDRLIDTDPTLKTFLESRAIGEDARAQTLERIFRGRISDLTLNTLLVMNRNDRAAMIHALREAYAFRHRESLNEIDVTVTSASELDADQRSRVEQTAAELGGKKPVVKYEVRPEILGGLIVQIGDVRYDYSVSRQLRAAASRLSERGERGLPVALEQDGREPGTEQPVANR